MQLISKKCLLNVQFVILTSSFVYVFFYSYINTSDFCTHFKVAGSRSFSLQHCCMYIFQDQCLLTVLSVSWTVSLFIVPFRSTFHIITLQIFDVLNSAHSLHILPFKCVSPNILIHLEQACLVKQYTQHIPHLYRCTPVRQVIFPSECNVARRKSS